MKPHKTVCEHESVTVLWNQGHVMANTPDLIFEKKRGNMLTDTCSNTSRQKRYAEGSTKKLKLTSLCIETWRKTNMNCMIIAVVIVGIEIAIEGLKKNLKATTWERSIYSL